MKNYKAMLFIILFFMGYGIEAQEIEHNGTKYYIKGKDILKDGELVTDSINEDLKDEIFEKHEARIRLEKEAKEREKDLKKAERKAEKAEKELKRAEKELKRQERLRDKFERASDKLEDAQKKYQRLRRKGKLSPNEEEDWLEKIEKLQDDVDNYRKKLRKS